MFNKINAMTLRVNGDKLHQTDRNALRLELLNAIVDVMQRNGVELGMVKEGIAVNLPHEELGAINFVVDVKMKGLDYDFDFEVADWSAEQKRKAEDKQAKAEAKARKIAEQKASN